MTSRMKQILAMRKTKGVSPAPDSLVSPEKPSDGRRVAAEELISAFHDKNSNKAMEALSNFMDLHSLKPKE